MGENALIFRSNPSKQERVGSIAGPFLFISKKNNQTHSGLTKGKFHDDRIEIS